MVFIVTVFILFLVFHRIDPTLAVLSDKGIIMRDCMKWNPKEETMIKVSVEENSFNLIPFLSQKP